MENDKKEEIKNLLTVVDNTIKDTKYVLTEDFKPYSGILKVLKHWILFYIVLSFLFYIADVLNTNFELYNNQWYYTTIRISNITLFTGLAVYYCILVNKTIMTLKEKNLLVSIIPIIISFSLWRMLFSISYYLNTDIMINLYNTFPLDICINIIGLFILYRYFKIKSLIAVIFINVIYIIGSTIWLSNYMKSLETSNIENQMFNLLSLIQENGIVIILSIGIFLLLLKREFGKNEYTRH